MIEIEHLTYGYRPGQPVIEDLAHRFASGSRITALQASTSRVLKKGHLGRSAGVNPLVARLSSLEGAASSAPC